MEDGERERSAWREPRRRADCRALLSRSGRGSARTKAKSWDAAVTVSLARLLSDGGRRDEARAMLADIYGWFTEGFDTADLKDAKALLDELNA